MTWTEIIAWGLGLGFALMYVTLIIIYIIRSVRRIKLLEVKMKYYDIVHAKFQIYNPSHPASLYCKDLGWFSKNEQKYLDIHFNEINKIKTTIEGIGM